MGCRSQGAMAPPLDRFADSAKRGRPKKKENEMAQTVAIPGRRVSSGETFYTDWITRGGDCVILRIEVLTSVGNSGDDKIAFALETQGEDGASPTTVTATYPTTGISTGSLGVATAIYVAGSTSGGILERVRVKITNNSETAGSSYVVRIFPIIFFDNAR
jgi:hypothetical protein